MKKKTTNKKAQMWVSDYTISLLLFVLAALLSAKIMVNSFSMNTEFEELKIDVSKISEIFLSEGYPVNWTNESAIRPGLLSGNRLSLSKVEKAMNSSYISYSSLKSKLQTNYEFLIIFEDYTGDMIEFNEMCTIGNSDIDIIETGLDCHYPDFTSLTGDDSYDNLVKIIRFVVYDSEIIRMVVYVWY